MMLSNRLSLLTAQARCLRQRGDEALELTNNQIEAIANAFTKIY